MKEEETVKVEIKKIADALKESLLGQSSKIACHNCDKPYCCRNQVRISISDIEFNQIEPLITDEQKKRAQYQLENKIVMNGQLVYTCPFNNPDTGKCEIYDNRFVVCAGHGVVADSHEVCNTETNNDGTMIVNPMNTMEIAMKKYKPMESYLIYLAGGKDVDVLDCFNRYAK